MRNSELITIYMGFVCFFNSFNLTSFIKTVAEDCKKDRNGGKLLYGFNERESQTVSDGVVIDLELKG